jgi:hypothetical protein
MSYTLKLYAWEDASPGQQEAALQRFRQALDASLGDESLVLPVYGVYRRIVATYGENPSEELLSDGELEILKAWQAAESAALTAALGPNRYMGDAEFEIHP